MLDVEENMQKMSNHYDQILDYEKIRLEQDSPVEYAITLRAMDKWIPDNSIILDIGVGVGHYSMHLARRNCKIHLVDVCESLLTATKENLAKANLTNHILSATKASAVSLKFIPDNSVDCVLMLGPLYHLTSLQERQHAISEAYRILKKGGILFAAGINRLSVLHELFTIERYFGNEELNIKQFYNKLNQYCHDGITDDSFFPPLSNGYCATVTEFLTLFSSQFSQLDFLGTESFSAFNQKKLLAKNAEERDLWLSLLDMTARTPEGIARAEHFLYVGKK